MKNLTFWMGIVAVIFLLSGPAAATVHNVAVGNFFFNPANITVAQGDTVIWTNGAGFHNVHHTGTPSLFGNTAANAPWTYTFVFDLPAATYNYICEVHPSMVGNVTVEEPNSVPEYPVTATSPELSQNYPNPFNSSTSIEFALPSAADVKLTVLNVLGQTVADVYQGNLNAGVHRMTFDASSLTNGLYYYRLQTAEATITRKMYYMK